MKNMLLTETQDGDLYLDGVSECGKWLFVGLVKEPLSESARTPFWNWRDHWDSRAHGRLWMLLSNGDNHMMDNRKCLTKAQYHDRMISHSMKGKMPMSKPISTLEAGRRLGRTIPTVCRLLRAGEIRGSKMNPGQSSSWLVDPVSVAAYLERQGKILTTGDVAKRMGVSQGTAKMFCETGAFPNAWRTSTPRGHWRIPRKDVERWTIKKND